MTFLTYSLFLGGLAAAAIPVLLHLMMRGVPKRIEFPALRLIQVRLQITRRNYRLKHLLLLALRILIVVLIGLMLARPSLKLADWFPSLTMPGASGDNLSFVGTLAGSLAMQDVPIAAALVIDTSPRMDYLLANRSRLELAREYARWVIGQLPKNSKVAIIDGKREAAAFQVDPLAAAKRLERLAIENDGRSVAESVLEAVRLLEDSGMEQQELYVFSDLTRPGWPADVLPSVRAAVSRESADSVSAGIAECGVYIVDLGADSPNNCGVVRLKLSEQVASANMPIRVLAEIVQIGDVPTRTVEMFLENPTKEPGNDRERHGSRQLRFTAGATGTSQEVSFQLPSLPVGVHQGSVRLAGSDPFAVDDAAYFTVEIRPAWRVLIVAPEPVRVHDRYLREALNPSQDRHGLSPFSTESVSPEALERMSLNDLQAYQAVMLLDPAPLQPATWKMLSDFAARGNGVAFFLGRRATPAPLFNLPMARDVLGGFPVRQTRIGRDVDLWIAPDDYIPSVFSTFRPLSVAETPWEELPVFRYWEMGDLTDRAEPVARFSDGRPAILMQRFGEGLTVTMTTPISDPPHAPADAAPDERPWNYLTDPSWVFLALMDGVARTLVGTGEQQFNFIVGRPAVIDPGLPLLPAYCLLTRPDGETVRLTPAAGDRLIRFSATDRPGQYRIRSGGAKERLDTGFSINFPPETSDFQRIGSEILDEAFGPKGYRMARTPAEIEIGIARRRVGQELYAHLFLLLCCFFVGEYLFAHFFYGKPDEQKASDGA